MIPLVVHSHYSLLRGTASPAALCAHARRLGYSRLALTDLDNLHGLWSFLDGCRRYDLVPIVGATVSGNDGSRVVCLVKDSRGYANLCQLLTHRHWGGTLEDGLERYGTGLVCLTDHPKILAWLRERELDAGALLCRRPNTATHTLRRLATKLELPAVAAPDAFFRTTAEYPLHRLLRAVAGRRGINDGTLDPVHPESWLAGPEEYRRRFAPWPETLAASEAIGERCTFTAPATAIRMPPWHGHGEPAARLRELAMAGARQRYNTPLPAAVEQRLATELAVIESMGFASYFLAVREIVPAGGRTCGRGSGAASLVSFCLGLTNVCPIRHHLDFSRFLHPGRPDPPDLDIDFPWDERDGILARTLERFGAHSAMVGSMTVMQPRLALWETARAFGLPAAVTRRLARRLGHEPGPRLAAMAAALGPPWPRVLELARALAGTPRLYKTHPGGVVITPEPVARLVPVQRSAKGVPVIQWDKDDAERGGLVKIDLLGNRSLAVIRDAQAGLARQGVVVEEPRWRPEEDPAAQRLVAGGRTMGCFYIESPAMRLLQARARQGDLHHLVIHSSIIRPAANRWIRAYLDRLHRGTWPVLDPRAEKLLAHSYGLMVYQEDVARVAQELAGFSVAQAHELRKIVAGRDQERLAAARRAFLAGCRQKGVAPPAAATLWEMVESFAGYSFCKAHSASYAQVSFQAAWLKAHYPATFMAAVLANGGGFYDTFAYVSEARRLGVRILPPDVHESSIHWTGKDPAGEPGWIRVGLAAVRDLRRATQEAILRERTQKTFTDAEEFFRRVEPQRDEAVALVHSGALDRLPPGPDRTRLLWLAFTHDQRPPVLAAGSPAQTPPPFPAADPVEQWRHQFRVLGFLPDRHPITLLRPRLRGVVTARQLAGLAGRQVRFCGWLLHAKRVHGSDGRPMAFLTLEDESGLVEATLFPAAYERYRHLLLWGRPLELCGRVEEEYGVATLVAHRLAPPRTTAVSPPLQGAERARRNTPPPFLPAKAPA